MKPMQNLVTFLLLLAALLYLLSPLDVVPDVFPGLGWLDDLLLVIATIWYLSRRRAGKSPWESFRGARRRWEGETEGRGRVEDVQDDSRDNPYAVLGLRPGASREEIKSAYRKAVSMYHPDKVAHLGKEFQELAHRKLLAIQKAYETLTKDR